MLRNCPNLKVLIGDRVALRRIYMVNPRLDHQFYGGCSCTSTCL